MKIAILFAHAWIPSSVDMTEYLRAIRRMGHQSLMICLDRSEGPDGYEAIPASIESLQNPDFYKSLDLDAVIAFTWFKFPQIITAIKTAGVKVLIRGDSDGLFSIRLFPKNHYRVLLSGVKGAIAHITGTKHFLHRYLFDYPGESADYLASFASADVAVLETQQAADNVARFLNHKHRRDLVSKLAVVPHLVSDAFLNGEIKQLRSKSIVAVGRWTDPQKNAPLLCAALDRHLAMHADTTVAIIGAETGRSAFDELTRKYPRVIYTGPQNAAGVRRFLSEVRVLLSSSRWEGAPVVANEALAMGCTIVGTPIPSFIDIANQQFGTVAASHSAAALAAALETEWNQWDRNLRNPAAIADHWRAMISADVVVGRLIELLFPSSTRVTQPTRLPQTV